MGGLAEFAWLHKGSVFRLPPSIPLDDAANFFIAYATAVLGLAELAAIKQGETVLILGAAGTTGSTAIEVSKALGAKVVACASTEEKRAHCLSLGADAVIDYTQPDWRRAAKKAAGGVGVDVVYDPTGGDFAEPALRTLAPGGRYLVVGFVAGITRVPLNLPLLKRCSIIGVNWGGEAMGNPAIVKPVIERLIAWSGQGKLRSPDQVLPLARTGEAFGALLDRKSTGTIVIRPGE